MENLIIREVSAKDELGILSIRNHSENYKWFFHNSPISAAEHKEWFAARLLNSRFFTLVAEGDFQVIGTASLNDYKDVSPKVSISIRPGLNNSGVGTTLLNELVLRSKSSDIKSLSAEILEENLISLYFFSKNGFIKEYTDSRIINNKLCGVIGLTLKLID